MFGLYFESATTEILFDHALEAGLLGADSLANEWWKYYRNW